MKNCLIKPKRKSVILFHDDAKQLIHNVMNTLYTNFRIASELSISGNMTDFIQEHTEIRTQKLVKFI